MSFWNWFVIKKPKRNKVRIIVARGLNLMKDGGVKDYDKYKQTYKRNQLTPYLNGKPVRFWKQIYSGYYDFSDEFVPIFYKRKRLNNRFE